MVVRFGIKIDSQIFYCIRHGNPKVIHLCGQILWIVINSLRGVQR